MPTGNELILNLDPRDTILRCKMEIQKKTGIPVEQQLLTMEGESLNDLMSYWDYSKWQDMIHL